MLLPELAGIKILVFARDRVLENVVSVELDHGFCETDCDGRRVSGVLFDYIRILIDEDATTRAEIESVLSPDLTFVQYQGGDAPVDGDILARDNNTEEEGGRL